MELSPLAAAGVLYASAVYGKKARKMRGGDDVVSTTPGGAVPVISAGKPEASPLVAGSMNLTGNQYVGATAASRSAPVSAPAGLLEGGGKKRGRKSKKHGGSELPPVPSMGGTCGHMATSIPAGTLSGGNLGVSPVVPGAVGGVAAQSMPGELMGGAKRRSRKVKKRGGAEEVAVEGGMTTPEKVVGAYEGGAKRRSRKGKKRGGDGAPVEAFNEGGSEAPVLGGFNSLLDDLKKQVGGSKQKGGVFKLYAKELAALSKKLKKLA